MKLVIAVLILLYGCIPFLVPEQPGKGNEPTYSGNGKGEQDAEIIKQCAFLAAAQDPSLNRDALFVLCLDENGVRAI
jgi:hypothetical protein